MYEDKDEKRNRNSSDFFHQAFTRQTKGEEMYFIKNTRNHLIKIERKLIIILRCEKVITTTDNVKRMNAVFFIHF